MKIDWDDFLNNFLLVVLVLGLAFIFTQCMGGFK